MNSIRSLTALSAVFLALHTLPRGSQAHLWGLDFLTYLPGTAVLVPLLGALLLFPAVQRRVVGLLSSPPAAANPWRSPVALLGFAVVGGAVLLSLSLALRSRLHLLGDGAVFLQIVGEIARLQFPDRVNEQLTYQAVAAFVRWWPDVPVERIARIASWTSGAIYWLVGLLAARSLGSRDTERSVLLAFLLTPAFVAVFFGYVETYSIIFTVALGYLWAGAETMRGRAPWVVPAILLGLLIALHSLNVVFVPAWLFFSAWHARRRAGIGQAVEIGLAWITPIAVTAGLMALTRFSLAEYFDSKLHEPLLPLLAEPGFTQAYRTLSWRHGLDLVNQYLLAAPAAVLGLAALRPRSAIADPVVAFLFGSAVVPVLFTLVANPAIGAFRDWDLLSIGALPLTLAVGLAFARSAAERPARARAAVMLCGVAALHTAGWIAVNASPAASAERFCWMLERAELSPLARAYGWETWANHARTTGLHDEALEGYRNALRADPSNYRYWVYIGKVQFSLNEAERALTSFAEAKKLDPTYVTTWLSEGVAHLQLGAWEAAVESLEHALTLDPDLDRARREPAVFALAEAYRSLGRHADAAAHLRALVERAPDAVEPLFVLGNVYGEMGDLSSAIGCFRRMVELAPRDHRGHYNLGVCYSNAGNPEQALPHFQRVLQLHPDSQQARIIRSRMSGAGP